MFWGGGTAPSPDSSPSGRGTHPPAPPPPRRLRLLDLCAIGAHSRTPTHSEVWVRACVSIQDRKVTDGQTNEQTMLILISHVSVLTRDKNEIRCLLYANC